MPAFLKTLTQPLTRPSLGFAAALVAAIYVWYFTVATRLRGDSALNLFTAITPLLLFWISLRALLLARKPPSTIGGSILFAFLLLNLALGLGAVALMVLRLGDSL